MSKNVPWTKVVEEEFRSRTTFTVTEDRVFTLHMPPNNYTQKEIAEELGISCSKVYRILRAVKDKYQLAYLESDTLPPFLANSGEISKWRANRITEGYDLSSSQVSDLIDEWVFNELHRSILKRRLLDGISFERLAEEYSMSVRHIKKIVYEAQERVYNHI